MPQTPYKGLEIPATGSLVDTWGTVFNASVLDIVDRNVGGVVGKDVTGVGSTLTLSALEAQYNTLVPFGVLSANCQITSSAQGLYCVWNATSGSFAVSITNGVGTPLVIPQTSAMLVFADTSNGVRAFGAASFNTPNPVPVGTAMLFVSGAVPSGWALYTSLNDYSLQLNAAGGLQTGGSVGFSTVFGLTATNEHVLTTAQLPSHNHTLTLDSANGGGSNNTARWSSGTNSLGNDSVNSDPTGGGLGHTHPIDMRVQHVTCIIGTRA